MADAKTNRRRRSSSILQVYHEPPEPLEQLSDQSALPNGNANWVNAKGEKGLLTSPLPPLPSRASSIFFFHPLVKLNR